MLKEATKVWPSRRRIFSEMEIYFKTDADGNILNKLILNIKYTGKLEDEKNTVLNLARAKIFVNGKELEMEHAKTNENSDAAKYALQLFDKIIFNFGNFKGKVVL